MKSSTLGFLLLFLLTLSSCSLAAQKYRLSKDLGEEWLFFEDGDFHPTKEDQSYSVVYLNLKISGLPGEFLRIESSDPIFVFVNNKMAVKTSVSVLNLDSLSDEFSSNNLLVAFYTPDGRLNKKNLKTSLFTRNTDNNPDHAEERRPSSFFRDFGISGALLLSIIMVFTIRLNPKLASDYFSGVKIFSLREEESQLYTRIGSSTNILFYVYCSLLIGYYLMIIFQFLPADYKIPLDFASENYGAAVTQWLKLSCILLLLLFAKIILVLGFSFLFGIPEVGGIHFFNWVRMLVVSLGVLTIVLFVYFIGHGYNERIHEIMLKLVAWIIGVWIILIFLKLTNKANASLFHLFSYICTTELIPFLFIIRVLYN